MTPEATAVLERYRGLCKLAELASGAHAANQARTREQMEKVNQFELAARAARIQYQGFLKQAGADDPAAISAKAALATVEANLAEGQGILQSLRTELPKIQAQMPSRGEIEVARRNAWEVIWEDLRHHVSNDIQQLVVQSYAALLSYKADSSYSVALASLFPPPSRQACAKLTEDLARLYSIPL